MRKMAPAPEGCPLKTCHAALRSHLLAISKRRVACLAWRVLRGSADVKRWLTGPILLLALALPAAAGIKVSIEGLPSAEHDNVEGRLTIKAAAGRQDLDEILVRSLHQQADKDIRRALQPYGYYEPKIHAELSGAAPDWRAVYRIEPGPRTLITHIEIAVVGEARDFDTVKEVLANLRMREGDPLLHENYESAKVRLQQAAYDSGFLDAAYTLAELRVAPAALSAEIYLMLDSGPRYYFGQTRIEAQGLDEEFVRNYVQIEPGAPFNGRQVLETQFALTDLDYFQSVEIIPLREEMSEDRRIPLLIHTAPRPRRRYEFGGGYGTDTGARLSSAAEFRRIGDKGHKLRGEARLSERKNTFGGEYRIPMGRKPGESISLTGTSTSEKFTDGGESLKYSAGVSLSRVPGSWQRRLYLQFDHEESLISGAFDTSDLLIPGMSLNRGETDDAIHTRRGWNIFADVHGANRVALSTASFLQVHGLLRGAWPLGTRVRLLGRAELGANFVHALDQLPVSQRFFAGGDQSVRGYAYQSLGPRDAKGRVTGGKYLTALSIESQYQFGGGWRNWGVAAFMDAGGAADTPGPKLSRGVGAGLRYRAPIGYINVDLAHPLDGGSKGVRLHISVRVGL